MKKRPYAARTSFSLPPELLVELDEVTRVMGYQERSRTLQTAIRNLVGESRVVKDVEAYATGAVVVLYDHSKRGIDGMITDVGHHFGRLIVSTLHVHMEGPHCLNTIVVHGKIGKLTDLERHLRELPGVVQVKATYVFTGPARPPGSGSELG